MLFFGNERQVSRDQLKVIDIPATPKEGKERWLKLLPRFGHASLGKIVFEPPEEGGTNQNLH